MLFDALAVFSFLIVLLLLKRLVNIYPSLMASLIRSKELINLEASVKLARDRDMLALAMVMPFCLVAFRFRLYSPGFLERFTDNQALGFYFLFFAAYLMMRLLSSWLFRPQKMPKKTYAVGNRASYSFFIVLTLVLLAMGGVLELLKVDESVVRSAMLWVSAIIYIIFLLRKTQIFATSCSIFTAFLYLCALEMIPTGILIVPAIIF